MPRTRRRRAQNVVLATLCLLWCVGLSQGANINYVNYGHHYGTTMKKMSTGTTNTNYLPIATSVKLTLEGDIPDNKFIAIVDKYGVGCRLASAIVVPASTTVSGVFQGVGKEFDIDLSTLEMGKQNRLCYAM